MSAPTPTRDHEGAPFAPWGSDEERSPRRERFFLHVLGCPKNQVDGGYLEGLLEAAGYEAVPAPEEADVLVVHTCGFVEMAAQESVDTLLELAELKRRRPEVRLVASGCLAQRHADDLAEAMPELDLVVGTRDWPRLPELLRRSPDRRSRVHVATLNPVDYSHLPFRPTGVATTYVKLSDGCNFRCAFCTIPSFAGSLRSKPPEVIVDEVRAAVAAGVGEVVLVAQDLTGYGRDRRGEGVTLAGLLRQLCALQPGPRWIRLMYATLEGVTDDLIEVLASEDRICKYLDMPLQHTHPATLRRMRRPYSADRVVDTVARLRRAIPDIAIRSTFVVGFPGETEAEFDHLLEFLEAAELDWVSAFAFSPEPGTAAAEMPDQVPPAIRRERRRLVYRTQAAISRRRNRRFVGRELEVLAEAVAPGRRGTALLVGRSFREAPEVDGRVVVRGVPEPGELLDRFLRVRVVDAATYQVGAVLVDSVTETRRPLRLLPVAQ